MLAWEVKLSNKEFSDLELWFYLDSGGPMAIVDERGIITQIGIVSFVSSRGCSFGDASGYTRVSKYLQWISTNAGIPLRR